ncbi:unnamed protein product [Caenorhabditis auriculariae]|uniref:CX domain-containing protein n=1 Tax=Caenorhabditis auriculariae TaxID=2777116 RepID=A0A8S1HDY3_9PELO|nr:unnamed protein product [Caenorhabditis auriculariae]
MLCVVVFCTLLTRMASFGAVPAYVRTPSLQIKETAGGSEEFLRDFLSALANESLTSVELVSDDPVLENGTYRIENSSAFFEFGQVRYFWTFEDYNTTEFENNNAWTCSFSTNDSSFPNVEFVNGSRLEKIYFGCDGGSDCCGLECCSDDVFFNIVIVVVISLSLVLLLVCNVVLGFKKRQAKRRNHKVLYEVPRSTGNEEVIAESQIHIRTT